MSCAGVRFYLKLLIFVIILLQNSPQFRETRTYGHLHAAAAAAQVIGVRRSLRREERVTIEKE